MNHPEGIKKILLAPLHKGYWYKAMAIPDYRFQTPMSQTDPKKKNEMSRQFSSGYTLSNVLQNEGAFDNMIELFLSRLDEYAKTGKAFDLDKYITFMAWDVIGEVIFSKPFGFLKENYDIGDAIENSKVLSVYASVVGFVRWFHVAFLGNPFMTWLGLLPMGHLYTHTVKALDERLDNRDSRFDCIAHWFRSIEKSAGKFKERDVYAVATGAVGAGSDTVSCAIQSFVYYLNRHQGLWERLQAEIDEAIKEKNICQDTVVTFADVQQLPFLQACIKEVLRIHAPVPMGLPRVAPEGGLTIGDTHIPQGTIISINSWVFHHNKEVWGDDAREFNPDRWMTAYAANLEKFFMPVSHTGCECDLNGRALTALAVGSRVQLMPRPAHRQDRDLQSRSDARPGLRLSPGQSQARLAVEGLLHHGSAFVAVLRREEGTSGVGRGA